METQTICPNCGATVATYRNPLPTVDVVVIQAGQVLLIERGTPPFGWALPGGFVEYGESSEQAAARELLEETGLKAHSLMLVGVYSQPGRDPRFHTISMVYFVQASGELQAGDDAKRAAWFPIGELPPDMAFDHRDIVRDSVQFRNHLEESSRNR